MDTVNSAVSATLRIRPVLCLHYDSSRPAASVQYQIDSPGQCSLLQCHKLTVGHACLRGSPFLVLRSLYGSAMGRGKTRLAGRDGSFLRNGEVALGKWFNMLTVFPASASVAISPVSTMDVTRWPEAQNNLIQGRD